MFPAENFNTLYGTKDPQLRPTGSWKTLWLVIKAKGEILKIWSWKFGSFFLYFPTFQNIEVFFGHLIWFPWPRSLLQFNTSSGAFYVEDFKQLFTVNHRNVQNASHDITINNIFTDTEVNNCFIIYHTSWITSGPKSNFICDNIPTKPFCFSSPSRRWIVLG